MVNKESGAQKVTNRGGTFKDSRLGGQRHKGENTRLTI